MTIQDSTLTLTRFQQEYKYAHGIQREKKSVNAWEILFFFISSEKFLCKILFISNEKRQLFFNLQIKYILVKVCHEKKLKLVMSLFRFGFRRLEKDEGGSEDVEETNPGSKEVKKTKPVNLETAKKKSEERRKMVGRGFKKEWFGEFSW